jgi:hypothetical protein
MSENNNFDDFRSFWRSISKYPIKKIDRYGIEIDHPEDEIDQNDA